MTLTSLALYLVVSLFMVISYVLFVGLAAVAALAVAVSRGTDRAAPPRLLDGLVLLAPIASYLLLIWSVDDRQGFNWWLADLCMAVPVSAGLAARPWISRQRFGIWAVVVAVVGLGTAYVAWSLVPHQGLTRLF